MIKDLFKCICYTLRVIKDSYFLDFSKIGFEDKDLIIDLIKAINKDKEVILEYQPFVYKRLCVLELKARNRLEELLDGEDA